MSRSRSEYIYRSRNDGTPLVEVTFDKDDGAIEEVRLYDEISDHWYPIKNDYRLCGHLEERIKTFIADWMQVHGEEIA